MYARQYPVAHPSPYKKQPKSQVKLINDSEAISNATYPALPRKQKVQWRLSGICVRKGIISVAILLILIMDQRRNLPAFMRVLKHGEAKRRWAIGIHTSIKKPGSDYALPGLRCRYVPVSGPVSTAPPGNKTQLSSWKAIIPTIAPTVPRIVSIIVQSSASALRSRR